MREVGQAADTQVNVSQVELAFSGNQYLCENVSGPEIIELKRM
jgi:hypothetical protein